jgi:aminoglycoside phosphotransferase family enzyme
MSHPVTARAHVNCRKLDAKASSRVQRPDTSMSQKAYAMLTAAHNPKSSLLDIEE